MPIAEFKDFSGGITDKNIPGQSNRYSTADNLLIDSDKQLITRDGFDIYSSTGYQLTTSSERTARLSLLESEPIAVQNKQVQYINSGAWTNLLGPTSVKGFNTNTAASLVTEAYWNKQLYLASDSGDPVIKIYRDGSNNIQLRTAGLPLMTSTTSPADGGLALAIALANDILDKMIDHVDSDGATVGVVNNSATGHHLTSAGLTAQGTALAALSNATNLATLITLVNGLRDVYNDHIADARREESANSSGTTQSRLNHVAPAVVGTSYYTENTSTTASAQLDWRHFLNFELQDKTYTIPSSAVIADVLPFLNDLRDKWNWHNYAPLTHYNSARINGTEYYTGNGAHKTSLSRVETYTWAQITPGYGPFIQYVKDIKSEYDAHRLSYSHAQTDTIYDIDSSYPTSPANFHEAVTLLGALAFGIYCHINDAYRVSFLQFTGTITGTTTTMTSVSPAPNALSFNYYRFASIYGSGISPYTWTIDRITQGLISRVSSTTATTIVVNTNYPLSGGPYEYLFTNSMHHYGVSSTDIFDSKTFYELFDSQDFSLSSAAGLQGFADLAETLIGYLEAHELSGLGTVESLYTNKTVATLDGVRFTPYTPSDYTHALGKNFCPHQITNDEFIGLIYSGATVNNIYYFPSNLGPGFEEDIFDTVPEAASVNYKACFKYTYTVGTTTYIDRSEPSEAINIITFNTPRANESTELGLYGVAFTNFYAYANASNENYATGDTTNFKKEIYRTVANGTEYFKANYDSTTAEITNATTTYTDYSVDEFLVLQEGLYTNGGVVANGKPPLATAIHQTEDRMYYVLGNKLYQSVASDPDSVPADFYDEYEEALVSVSSTRSVVVAFTANFVARVEGSFNELGQGFLSHEIIYDRTGLISNQALCKAENGIFFCGKDGIYYTDGYQCFRVIDLEDTFKGYTDSAAKRNMIQATYNPVEQKAYFTVPSGNLSYPDAMWVLDTQFGIRPEEMPITTFSGGTGFNPTAILIKDNILHYGDKDGYIFKQTADLKMDLVKNTSVAATSWDKRTVFWEYKSCHLDYGSAAKKKYFLRTTWQFEQQDTNLSVQIYSDADNGKSISNLPIIRSRKLSDWGDSKIDWTVAQYGASKPGDVIDEFRRFRGDGYLRSNFRAVGAKNAYCVVVASDNMGTVNIANISANLWSATLTNASYKWPLYSVGYYLRIAGVDYPVTVRTSDSVIRVSDSGLTALSVQSGIEWELWGYPKNEKAKIIEYSVVYDILGDTQKDYQGTTSLDGGENA